jgi:hypothetical protein
MSGLKYTVDFVSRKTGKRHTAIVDLGDFSARELDEAWRGPNRFEGPVAAMYAYAHAARCAPPDYLGLPQSVRCHRVQ